MSKNEQPLFKKYVGASLEECLESLAVKRPVFHSEADFQFALAQEIESIWGKTGKAKPSIRLEYPFRTTFDDERDKYVDIVIILDGSRMIPIELKYKTAELNCDVLTESGAYEKFNLCNHSACDLGRYDCLNDVKRVEDLISPNTDEGSLFEEGYTIWLTNDSHYEEKREGTKDEQFSLHNGEIGGPERPKENLFWQPTKRSPDPKSGVSKHRQNSITLRNAYTIKWKSYADCKERQDVKNISDRNNSKFHYVLLEIPSGSSKSQ